MSKYDAALADALAQAFAQTAVGMGASPGVLRTALGGVLMSLVLPLPVAEQVKIVGEEIATLELYLKRLQAPSEN